MLRANRGHDPRDPIRLHVESQVKALRRILVIDDDPKTGTTLEPYLRQAGYKAEIAPMGYAGLARARQTKPDLIIFDHMLPGLHGADICRALHDHSAVPIIMLTARSTEEDKLRGLAVGADDYVTKPFSPREVVARVTTVLRRSRALAEDGDLTLDPDTREVTLRGVTVRLTTAEFNILQTLIRSPERVFTRDELMLDDEALERTVDVHIKNLRKKIEDERANPRRIVTVFGVGYKYVLSERQTCSR
jgi:DNA-binding response OmpR family regulator